MYAFHQEQHLYALHMAQEEMLKSTREKSWVMTSNEAGFVKLPNERILYTSPLERVYKFLRRLHLLAQSHIRPKVTLGLFISVTNDAPTPELQSFSSPILNLQDSYVRAPFFGANYWTALCKPVSGGGIPPDYPSVELKMTFREGGAFDFHSCLEQIKEHLVNMDLEQLPAYEAATEVTDEAHEVALDSGVADTTRSSRPETFTAPAEPPPDYEEVQAQAVSVDLDQRLREQAERQ
ncbi:ww-domain ligand protein [Botrytis cinerea]